MIRLFVCGCVLLIVAACEREARPFEELPGRIAAAASPTTSPFQENAWGISEGKRFFDQYNCVGCHSHGGGGMGPALMDDRWIYGSEAGRIYESIVEGRPNGMPAFGSRIADAQVWQLVAFVQSMSGHAPIAALPGRSDHLSAGTPENMRPARRPVQTGTP